MVKQLLMRFTSFMLSLCFLIAPVMAQAETQYYNPFAQSQKESLSCNPLIEPQSVPQINTPNRFTNILLLGIDFGFWEYRGSGSKYKRNLEDCHTDAIMVVSINQTTNEVNLVSLPRDTLTYIPEVHGIYKLNGAFNCADTLEEGFGRICDAATWLLGGIPIDYYCAVDMAAMIALGDFIGGVDLNVEMTYYGHSGKRYYAGYQHLDGYGITDYARARKNATVNGNDIGRTGRQRQLMEAIFEKVKANSGLIKSGWDYANSGEINFFTNMKLANALNLLNQIKNSEISGSYVLTGSYQTALSGWNFTFTDQENRIDVIRKVYGVDVPEIPYVSYSYTEWLVDGGLKGARYISIAGDILEYAESLGELTQKQQDAVDQLREARKVAAQDFDKAADSMDYNLMYKSLRDLRLIGNQTAKVIGYRTDINDRFSGTTRYWYNDPFVNEYQYSWQ